jgi:uncharacterized protein (DUF885 family)
VRRTISAALAACLAASPLLAAPAQSKTQSAAVRTSEGDKLARLFRASDEASLRRNPLSALYRGDPRYADRFGDYISDAYFAAEKAAAVNDLAALSRINRARLSPEDRISYDSFKWQTELNLRGFAPALLKASVERPIDHFNGLQVAMPDLSSGEGAAPFKTLADYENNLKRLDGYIVFLDRAIERMRQGMADGIVQPRLVMSNVIAQLDSLLGQGVEGSTFYKPITRLPKTISPADGARLKVRYAAFIRDRLNPAHQRLRDFIRDVYLPKTRESVGLREMPGGAALYAYLAESNTTTDMAPEQIHQLGLAEVARIHGEMEKAKAAVGFTGNLQQFAELLRTDARFKPASAAAMREAFLAIDKRVKAVIAKDFSTLPRSPLEIRAEPPYKEKTAAGGEYMQGTPDGSRPGVFYYNAYDLPSRYTWGYETLFLHEGSPGHHFQISLAQENASLPAFQRFGGNTAFVEGWALYAESLGRELGFFTDPYQQYGHLNDEILRAMRLVVDTGLHAKGWSRDQAIKYMLDNSAMSPTDATAEVERYIAIPGQALAYKVGQLTIRRLRTRAEQALGPKFDVRDFHAQVLMSGALPMAVLEAKIDNWIAAKKRS